MANQFPPPKINNAAGRLLAILDRIKKVPAGWLHHITLRVALFPDQVGIGQTAPLPFTAIQRLTEEMNWQYRNILDIEQEIKERQPEHAESFLKGFDSLKRIFCPDNLITTFDRALVAEDILVRVEHCAISMAKERDIEESDLQDVMKQILELIDLIETTEMPKRLRNFLFDLLQAAQRAIMEYRTRGPKGLKEALANIIGGLWVSGPEINKLPDKAGILNRFGQVWSGMALLARIATDTRRIVEVAEMTAPTLTILWDQFSN